MYLAMYPAYSILHILDNLPPYRFIKKYFFEDGSFSAGYQAFLSSMIVPFRDTVKSWKDAKERLVREEKFNAFRKARLHETRMYRSIHSLRLFPPRCDLYIAGSDQLWNSKLTDQKFDPAYFLNFGPKKTMRITYAVGSYFADPAAAKAEIAPLLKKVNCISLREKKFLNDVKDAAYRNMRIHIDVDPTLLLDASAYDALLPKEPLEKDPYIVVYSMPGPAQKQVNEAAKAIAEKTGLHLIDVNGNPNAGNRQIEDQRICSPGEFLWYIKNATYVVTNSFHGTVFSVLYEKRFAVILHKETGNRVSELLESLGLATYCTGKTEAVEPILNRPINWKNVKSKLWRLREDSLDYLRYWCIGGPRPEFVTDRKEPEKPAAQHAPKKAAPKPADKPEITVPDISVQQVSDIKTTDGKTLKAWKKAVKATEAIPFMGMRPGHNHGEPAGRGPAPKPGKQPGPKPE